MANNLIIPEKIRLFKVAVINNYINDKDLEDDLDFEFSVANNTKHNLKDERVKIELFINLLSPEEKGLKYHIDFHFVVIDLKDHYVLEDDDKVIFSTNFIATLLGISFSTARGILFEQLQSTELKGMILPVVSPYKMLKSINRK